jgi:hypothetical protein
MNLLSLKTTDNPKFVTLEKVDTSSERNHPPFRLVTERCLSCCLHTLPCVSSSTVRTARQWNDSKETVGRQCMRRAAEVWVDGTEEVLSPRGLGQEIEIGLQFASCGFLIACLVHCI